MAEDDASNYVVCKRLSIVEAIQARRVNVAATLAPYREVSVRPMFFRHSLPFQFSHWGHIFFTPSGDQHISRHQSVEIIDVPRGRVVASEGVVLTDETTIIDQLLQFLHVWRPESFFRMSEGDLLIRQTEAVVMPGTYFLGVIAGDANYAHWVTYTLPAWLYYRERLMDQGVKLVVGQLSKFQTEALALLGIPNSALFQMPEQVVEFESLQLMTPISMWCPSSLIANIGQSVARLAGGVDAVPRRIYLSRRDVDRRRLLNEKAVEKMLALHGFVSVACSELTFAEQVQAFANADIVVGVHGAALGNTLFCQAGARVIEVFPEYCAQPHFRALSDRIGLSYGFVLGTTFEPENGREKSAAWDRDFVVDVEVVESAVKQAITVGRQSR